MNVKNVIIFLLVYALLFNSNKLLAEEKVYEFSVLSHNLELIEDQDLNDNINGLKINNYSGDFIDIKLSHYQTQIINDGDTLFFNCKNDIFQNIQIRIYTNELETIPEYLPLKIVCNKEYSIYQK